MLLAGRIYKVPDSTVHSIDACDTYSNKRGLNTASLSTDQVGRPPADAYPACLPASHGTHVSRPSHMLTRQVPLHAMILIHPPNHNPISIGSDGSRLAKRDQQLRNAYENLHERHQVAVHNAQCILRLHCLLIHTPRDKLTSLSIKTRNASHFPSLFTTHLVCLV
jgi:hypothetical protein